MFPLLVGQFCTKQCDRNCRDKLRFVQACVVRHTLQTDVKIFVMNDIIKKRIIAYLIDGVIIITPLQIFAFLTWDKILNEYSDYLIIITLTIQFVPFILYFMISEFIFSKTIGKKIMKLEVEFEKNRIASILIRSLSRLIPLEIVSFFYFENKLLHDILSKTSVVSKN